MLRFFPHLDVLFLMLNSPHLVGPMPPLAERARVMAVPKRSISAPLAADHWKYSSPRQGAGIIAMAAFVSAALHLIALYGFNQPRKAERRIVVDDTPTIQIAMPDLKDLDEPEPLENLEDNEVEVAAVPVPMLIDMPTVVPVDAFVQQMDYKPPVQADLAGAKTMAIPVHVARGNIGEKIGKIFDLSQLDRVPEAIVQVAPIFPASLKREVSEARVLVEFIVDSKGEVVAPYVVDATHRGFEEAAVSGVSKWKFRPGMKGGKRVNTRMRVPLIFRINDEG